MKIDYLDEPELEFGGNGRHVDIRFGLMDYGALDRGTSRAPTYIKVGIVGTPETIQGITAWLERCRKGVDAKKSRQPNLFPRFPGEEVFGTSLVFDKQLTATITQRAITGLLTTARTAEGVAAAVQAFVEQARHLCETVNPDVVVCAPPAVLFDALAVVDDYTPEQVDIATASSEADGAEDLPPVPVFHDLLKARSLTLPCPIQMVRPETYDQSKRRRQVAHPERTRDLQDEATRVWNFYTALYYKAGGVPWRLARDPGIFSACFVGISFYRTPDGERLLTSMAHVFNELGNGMIVRGGPAHRDNADRQVHLDQAGARALLQQALRSYRLEHGTMPARLVVHKTSLYNEAERLGLQEAADGERIEELDLLTVGRSMTKLFRQGTYPPLRGTLLSLEEQIHVLYTRGSVDFFATYPGMYVPQPLRLHLAQTDQSARFLGEELLALTKMNWNNTQFDQRDPITIRAARQVGAILKHVEGDLPQGRYAYYM